LFVSLSVPLMVPHSSARRPYPEVQVPASLGPEHALVRALQSVR
jgi:hypothetical protein